MRVPGVGSPRAVLQAAVVALARRDIAVLQTSSTIESAPIGPALRRYANAAIVVETGCPPPAILELVTEVERSFGRRRIGQRWRARTLDLDIILWNGGFWHSPDLTIPHPRFRERRFALGPASSVAPEWVDPLTGASLRQLDARLTRPRPLLR